MENIINETKNYLAVIGDKVKNIEITDIQGLEQAQEILSYNKIIGKEIKEKKEAITKPLNESLKEVRALFNPVEEQLEHTESVVKMAMLEFKRKLDEERKAEVLKMQESDEQEPSVEIVEKVKAMETIKTRKTPRLKIIDIEKIPDDFWLPNEDLILATLKNGIVVGGCELIYEETVINNY